MESTVSRRVMVVGLVLVALAGFVLRVGIARYAMGTNDSATFIHFGYGINDPEKGLIQEYKEEKDFNHPPLVGLWVGYCHEKAGPNNGLGFSFLFKLPMIAADLLGAWLLYDLWRPRRGHVYALAVAAAFAWSIDSILVTAFHCNTDSLYAVLVLLSAYLIERRRMHFLGGLALAAAINVKLIPVVLVAPMLLSYRSWREAIGFGLGLAVGLAPFVPIVYLAGEAFHRNAVAYNSNVCLWGVNHFLLRWRDAGWSEHTQDVVQHLIDQYSKMGRYLIMGGAAAIGGVNHFWPRWNRYQLCAICLGLFLVLTPGFGVQYSVMVVPVMLAVSLGWGVVYSTLVGAFIGIVYWFFMDSTGWWYSNFTGPFPEPGPLLGLAAWGVLAVWVAKQLRLPAAQVAGN